ncbi:protoporphyrinogen oxidase [Specibacter cremeus]|uniref:protoporphyrinogen oxidase n=1 Tax=Specibacter cremeus TaxID=1629051 RepID=UPI000F7886A1|nr:protoporphyrinogen oxidase [Specibacter cremeus]
MEHPQGPEKQSGRASTAQLIHRLTHRHGDRPAGPHAVVVGGGVSGLLAARDLAAAGHAVTVLEAGSAWGGCVGVHEVAGLRLDSGAESFATRTTAVADLAAELGLGGRLVSPNPAGAWVALPDGPVPLPRTGILGIPADVHAPEVRAALGRSGVLRAALDARLPVTVGTTEKTSSVADLVRARMGERVLDRLVAPVVAGVHSADPELLDVDMVAPGLRAGIREHGSLAAAVAALRGAAGETDGTGQAPARPGSAVGGLSGGMHVLVEALVAGLERAGVDLRLRHTATVVSRTAAGTWTVGWDHAGAPGGVEAEVLVLATDGPTVVRLLGAEVPALVPLAPERGPNVRLVTLVVDLPDLDAAPRGTGVLVAPQTPGIRAKALTHATAKWEWLADETGPGTHVLRLSYGRAGDVASEAVRLGGGGPGDAELFADALADATILLATPISVSDVLGWDVVRWRGALPFAAVGHKARMAQLRDLADREPGLLVVGGWVAGNGLAAVVADTRARVAALAGRGTTA